MTAVPTPGDIARQGPRRPLTARPVGAATTRNVPPPESSPFRQRYEWLVLHSRLFPQGRLVALAIATRADYSTGVIPLAAMPGVPTLARATGLSEVVVRGSLHDLVEAGFLRRTVADEGTQVRLQLFLPEPPPS